MPADDPAPPTVGDADLDAARSWLESHNRDNYGRCDAFLAGLAHGRARIERLEAALAELRAARAHYLRLQGTGDSLTATRNGRHGGSPLSELMQAVDAALAAPEARPAG